MKDTFKAIELDRKQRIAFLVIIIMIAIGTAINIRGYVTDQNRMEETISLDEVITKKHSFKSYYKSKYQSSYSRGKSNYSSSHKTSQGKSKSPDKSNSAFTRKWKREQSDDTLRVVDVPSDYALESSELLATNTVKTSIDYNLHPFDPNSVTRDDLMLMYLPERWVNNVIAYRSKGGVYRKKSDVKKLYTTTDELYASLEPYLQITQDGITQLEEQLSQDKEAANQAWLEEIIKTSSLLDVNKINAETLVKLPKVTASIAKKIVKYRNLLGGYHDESQLLEVYDLDQSIFDAILPYLTIDPILELIDINTDDINQLNRHPYIGYKKAKVIQRYRGQHGDFESVAMVKKVGVWKSEKFALLQPYLMVQENN